MISSVSSSCSTRPGAEGEVITVRAIFLLVPPCAEAQDKAPAAEPLESGAHLGEECGIAEGLREHRMTKPELRMECRHVGKRGEALEHSRVPKLEMIDDPR
jgi:hypothetical protein